MASEGDPRVLLVMNVVLSSIFATVVVWGLDVVGALTFTTRNVVGLAAVLVVLTYLVVIR
jgi:uncharacterized membrane protein